MGRASTAAVDEVVPRAEVLRPGLLVMSVRGASRYFGSEQAAAERLVDAVAAAGAECQAGVADQLATAVMQKSVFGDIAGTAVGLRHWDGNERVAHPIR